MRSLRSSLLVSLLCAATFAVGCAEERPPVVRIQPNYLHKSALEGEWHYGRTVVDVPGGDVFTFVGASDFSGVSRITWDIQEDMLLGRRTTELVKNADGKIVEGEKYKGEVIAAFRIEKHFDIINAYNPTTGEQLNVLDENTTDRPWYQREYIRVNWAQNNVHNYQLDFEAASVEPIPYFVQEFDKEGERNPDAPYFEKDGSYFDVTNKLFAKAGTTYYPGYGEIPLCWLNGNEFTECGAGEYTIRHSFKKIDPNHQYVPMAYKGPVTEMFGFFETSRMVYDPSTGIREQGRERYINRHNLWKKWKDANGNDIPYADRELRPIVYYANTDLPDYLKPIGQEVARQWNEIFTDTVRALGHEPKGPVFVFCENNPVLKGDPAECGEPGLSPRIGDIRYSFIAYVPKYMTYGLLGLGPSNNDPETGEIMSGMAYVYHHNNLAAYNTQEMIELLNGGRDQTKFIEGVDLTQWAGLVNSGKELNGRTHGLEASRYFVSKMAHGPSSKAWANLRQPPSSLDEQAQVEKGFQAWVQPYLTRMYNRGILNGTLNASKAKLARLAGTPIEQMLLDKEILMAAGHQPGTPVTEDLVDRASVARGGFGSFLKHQAKAREAFAEARNHYVREMADDALMGLARELKDRPGPEVFETVRRSIYTAVLAHEVGHSLGLMHNFGGSDDAINYHDEYWQLRAADGEVRPRLQDPLTEAELNGKIYNYGYSSVMDYAGRYTIDGAGVGKYDRAAMLYGYAGKVEVFKDVKNAQNNNANISIGFFRDWFSGSGDVVMFANAGPIALHYTTWWDMMGERLYQDSNRLLADVETLAPDLSTAKVDGTTYVRVPYVYCSHNRANLGDSCLTRDFGADSQERMKNILDDLNTWYILRNFPRGKIGVSNWTYVGSWYGRTYDRMKQWHNLYGLYAELLPQFYSPEQMEAFFTDPKNGWGGQTWAVQNAFNFLVQTMLTPDVGAYNPVEQADGSTLMQNGFASGFQVDIINGRYYSTDWSREASENSRSCGYQWWECLHHVGFYLDKIMAIEALSDSETNFVARSTPEDIREWEVSYYNTFSEQIAKLNEAILGGNWSKVGPYVENGELKYPNYAGPLDEVHSQVIDPFATFSVQLYWQVLGQARFFNNYNQSFRDESRIFLVGTGTAPDVDPSEVVQFRDPLSGMKYGALKMVSQPGGARSLIEKANTLMSRSSFCDASAKTSYLEDDCTGVETADSDLLNTMEFVKVIADLSPMMDYGNPYAP